MPPPPKRAWCRPTLPACGFCRSMIGVFSARLNARGSPKHVIDASNRNCTVQYWRCRPRIFSTPLVRLDADLLGEPGQLVGLAAKPICHLRAGAADRDDADLFELF